MKKVFALIAASLISAQVFAASSPIDYSGVCGMPKVVEYPCSDGSVCKMITQDPCPVSEKKTVQTKAEREAEIRDQYERAIRRQEREQEIAEYNRDHPAFGSKGFMKVFYSGGYTVRDIATGKISKCTSNNVCSQFE